ncbi:MAG TPA: type II toxin-antitoxin system prevent-host-death family antitoxin [Phycicoccus sp.]|jgi:antitoxin (DNA-binding transcriptional repressor) of toxin-antitoxin stability system|nr:type II toxin-antitoxin system prevent-host-death family antitoxin [Phycicoccus sp.]HRA45815.1 type II toxin-antitoxin system prevent-host-death family antitoxin [Phycicoccus sp.]
MSAQPVEPPASSSPPNAPAKRIYNVHEAKTNLSKLLERVEAGEEITIARSGKPVAVLKAPPANGVHFGVLAGWDWKIDWETFDDPDPELIAQMEDGDI